MGRRASINAVLINVYFFFKAINEFSTAATDSAQYTFEQTVHLMFEGMEKWSIVRAGRFTAELFPCMHE